MQTTSEIFTLNFFFSTYKTVKFSSSEERAKKINWKIKFNGKRMARGKGGYGERKTHESKLINQKLEMRMRNWTIKR